MVQVSEKSSKKAEKIKIAKGLVKAGISVDIVSQAIGLPQANITQLKEETF